MARLACMVYGCECMPRRPSWTAWSRCWGFCPGAESQRRARQRERAFLDTIQPAFKLTERVGAEGLHLGGAPRLVEALALQGVPVVFLDATFDEEAFKVLLGRYIHENSIIKRESLFNKKLGSINDLKIKIYRSNLKKREITIHRMDKDNYYYKIGFFNYQEETRMTENGMQTIDEIRSYINKAKRKFATIGIITYKGLKPHFRDLGPTEHYFNLKGSNELANVEALFIIGTPHAKPKDIVKEYNNICLTQISPKQVHRKIYKKLKNGYFIVKEENWESFNEKPLLKVSKEKKPRRLTLEGYTWWNHKILFNKQSRAGLIDADIFYPLRDFDYNNSESEKYQAIHRARLFRRGNVPEIYIFGDVPDQVKEEFNVKILDKKRSKEFFMGRLLKYKQFGGMYPLPLSQLITAIKISNSSLKPIDIGKKLKLYKDPDKKSGYNTSFINKIINGTVSLNKMSIIHEDIKKGIIDTKLIKKHSKVDEEFIDDCLMYAYDGDFIQPES